MHQDDQRQDEPLPPGWEMRLDTYGRRYYVDHNTRYSSTYILEFVVIKTIFDVPDQLHGKDHNRYRPVGN